ncbi:carbohydrate ABC transporter permease [Kaistia dalseonensis]|uniref:Multiple sugar transport system permease protein n=1 Tax=Kaistia dalseonensis TaxID=410840 RepID=A0ABU0H4Y1_9HYPH|nr:carbohydrate ABC transporter permease [Kaistia dalseonensis]MCX5494780.1 carbohydrate ABC transporter permease [Kaistia dalseonensis]MDQ0437361.1 multiple sugar transport system permease protein [Kaistia dalseonensis]
MSAISETRTPARTAAIGWDVGAIVKFVAVTVIALVVISPLFLLVVASLKPDRFQILADMGSFRAFWVSNPSLDNYRNVATFSGALPFGRYLLNSLVILFCTVLGGIFINSMAAFVLAWGRLPGRAIILTAFIALYIVPQESIVLPLLTIVNKAGLSDTFAAQILPWMASPLYIFLIYQFFIQIPRDVYDAATVDGASPFRIYWSVFLPISGPVLATVAILLGIETWNQYLWPLMVTNTDNARPISVGIASFFGHDSVYWNSAMAASVMMMAPVLIFYLAFQRWFVSSFISSAVKG